MRIAARLTVFAAAFTLAGCADPMDERADRNADVAEVNEGVPQPEPTTAPPDDDGVAPAAGEPEVGEAPWVETTLISREGNPIGNLSIEPVEQGVRLAMHVEGLSPGPHAVHFHEHGRCEPPDFESAGSHFDPAGGGQHGMPDGDQDPEDPDHHAGDMLNQDVNDQELLSTVMVNDTVALSEGQPNSLVEGDGTALIIHAQPDDYESQPSGDAGDRVACAPITSEQTVGTG